MSEYHSFAGNILGSIKRVLSTWCARFRHYVSEKGIIVAARAIPDYPAQITDMRLRREPSGNEHFDDFRNYVIVNGSAIDHDEDGTICIFVLHTRDNLRSRRILFRQGALLISRVLFANLFRCALPLCDAYV